MENEFPIKKQNAFKIKKSSEWHFSVINFVLSDISDLSLKTFND